MKTKTNIIEFNPETVVIDYNITEAGLAELRKEAEGLKIIDNESYEIVKQVRSKAFKLRTGVEKMRVEKKSGALEFGRRIDAEAKRVTILLEGIENPLKAEINAWDNEKARIKLEKEKLDRERISAIIDRIERIKNAPLKHQGKTAEKLAEIIEIFENNFLGHHDTFDYQEFLELAKQARKTAEKSFWDMYDAKVEQEAEAIRLAAERKQLEEEKAAWEAKKAAEASALDITQPRTSQQALADKSNGDNFAKGVDYDISKLNNETKPLVIDQQFMDISLENKSHVSLADAIAQVEAARSAPELTRTIPAWATRQPTYNDLIWIIEKMLPRISAKTQEEFEFYENVKKMLKLIKENNQWIQ